MIEFLAFIVLVAIFFGVSLSTALYGTINAMLIIFLISFVFVLLTPSAKKFWEWFTDVEPQKPQTPAAKKSTKKRKVNAKRNNICGWIVVFIICYLITACILFAINFLEIEGIRQLPIAIKIALPSLPFIAIFASYYIKNAIDKKRASR
jgi:Mn2+/Fe2+ NRAMP family transporter